MAAIPKSSLTRLSFNHEGSCGTILSHPRFYHLAPDGPLASAHVLRYDQVSNLELIHLPPAQLLGHLHLVLRSLLDEGCMIKLFPHESGLVGAHISTKEALQC